MQGCFEWIEMIVEREERKEELLNGKIGGKTGVSGEGGRD